MDHEAALTAVVRAHEAVRDAGQQLREAVIDAVEAGVPCLQIASATGISRTTIWRWTKAERADA